jgi:ubiquinone/menaquinone biosynthesis C-methylase UbiE
MRVLDLGCGTGQDLAAWGVTSSDWVTGLDIELGRLRIAKTRFSDRRFLQAVGESLPFKAESFGFVVSSVALPYMNIPLTLAEIYRVLIPGGALSLSLHLPGFTMNEFVRHALPRPVPTFFRLYVMANGLLFHWTGNTIGFANGRTESFQTERGMRIALQRAGFVDSSFIRGSGPSGSTFTVEARRARN